MSQNGKNDIDLGYSGVVGALEEKIDKFFKEVKEAPDTLTLDMSQCEFVEVASLIWIVSFISSCNKSAIKTRIKLPISKDVRDFFQVWEFPRAIKHATGISFDDLLDQDDAQMFSKEKMEKQDKIKYASIVLRMNGIEQRLLSEGFFEIVSIPPKKVKSLERRAEEENERWQDDRVISVLNHHLNKNGNTVSSHIVHEAMMNALRHPQSRIIQTTSFFDSPDSYLLSRKYGIAKWKEFFLKLKKGIKTEHPSPEKRIWMLLPEDIQNEIKNATNQIPVRKTHGGRVTKALNNILEMRELYDKTYFSMLNLPPGVEKLIRIGTGNLSVIEIQKLNRYLLEAVFPEGIASCPKGHLTIVYWDDGESIVTTLFNAITEEKAIRSIYAEDLYADYLFVVKNENNVEEERINIRSDFLPDAKTSEELILLASTFPGITRDVKGKGHKTHSAVKKRNELLGLPGMGLYVLTNQTIDVFSGSVSLRTKNYFLNVETADRTPGTTETIQYQAKVRRYGSWCPEFRGNMLTVRLPFK